MSSPPVPRAPTGASPQGLRAPRARGILVLLAVVVVVGLASCGPGMPAGERRPNLLVVVLDGLRADHVSHLGYERPTTPVLDGLASEGFSFTQAFSSASQLIPAHVGLLTGCDPNVARRIMPGEFAAPTERRWAIPRRVPHLAVELLVAGYRTGAFVDHDSVSPVFGFHRGFEEFVDSSSEEGKRGTSAQKLTYRLNQWLRGLDRDEPWFAYLHLHMLERIWNRPDQKWEGYFQPDETKDEIPPVGSTDSTFFSIPRTRWRGGLRTVGQYEAIYDGHLRRLDGELDRLLGQLATDRRLDETTVVVVGSFGIQFGEAGRYLAGGGYSLAELHVPLVIRPARSLVRTLPQGGVRVDSLVSTIDLAPTLLELAGVEPPLGTHGISHAARIRGEDGVPPTGRYLFASCGLQEGRVVIGERMCLEVIQPEKVDSPLLERSWFGQPVGESTPPFARFYDRIEDPNPLLSKPAPPGTEALLSEYAVEGARWFKNIRQARRVLQSRLDRDLPEVQAMVSELQRLGFLGEEP